jgi:protein-L-isoaspartate(D-aspartate) O-methyltransferase
MLDVAAARHQMIEQQVRAWEVLDPEVLAVMERVPREEFAPPRFRDLAFADAGIPLGHGQSMLAPKIEGRMLQALAARPGETALEVGTGSGFFAACLAQFVRSVRSLEIFPDLAEQARDNLVRTGARNVMVEAQDAFTLESPGEYDVIALTGSLPLYDARFERALRVGGRLFVTVGLAPIMEARLVTRTAAGEWRHENLFETVMDALVHAPTPPEFVF